MKVRTSVLSGGKYRRVDEPGLSKIAADRAYAKTGLKPADIDVVELHGATSFSEIYQAEMIGFCAPGEGGRLVESGATAIGGRIPINTSGGLVSKGHPVGATGLSMIYELCLQLRSEAGPSFETFQQSLSNTTTFKDFVSPASQTDFNRYVQAAMRDRLVSQGQLNLGPESQRARYDCFLIPLPRRRVLIFAEIVPIAPDLPEKYQSLRKDFTRLNLELQKAKLALENKQKELQAVIAQADEVSHTDALTFLPNRRQIIGDLQREVMRSDRYG